MQRGHATGTCTWVCTTEKIPFRYLVLRLLPPMPPYIQSHPLSSVTPAYSTGTCCNLAWPSPQVSPVDTNIVIFTLQPGLDAARVTEQLKGAEGGGVLISGMGPGVLRLVTHLDVGQAELERAIRALRALKPEARSA